MWMDKPINNTLNFKKRFLSHSKNTTSNFKKVDINILLNRVKINKNNEMKKNIIFVTSIFVSLSFTAFIIFN